MTRIVEHRQDAAGEEVFELRVFQLKEGDVRACVVPSEARGSGLSRCVP